MAQEGPQTRVPGVVAGADLRTHQYKFVKLSASNTVVLCAAVTDIPIGVLQDTPNTGQAANVCMSGETKLASGAALAAGAAIGTAADGRGAAYVAGTDITKYLVGQVLVASAGAGELATVLISCMPPNRGA